MVSVAKSFDAPIKLLFPRGPVNVLDSSKRPFSMLGLGDIVIPGLYVALILRMDMQRKGGESTENEIESERVEKETAADVLLGSRVRVRARFSDYNRRDEYLRSRAAGFVVHRAWFVTHHVHPRRVRRGSPEGVLL